MNQLDLHPPVTQIAAEQQWLHNFMLIVCLVIFVAVFGVMFYSIFKHRKSKGAKAANFHESTTVEIAWTIVPFIIVIGMALPATKVVVAMKDTTNADLTIKATGYQWKWGYDYLQGRRRGHRLPVDSRRRPARDVRRRQAAPATTTCSKVDNPLVVPVDRKVRIITTANDVIHAWGVPSLGVKQDAIPGFVRDTWFRAEQDRRLLRPVRRAVRQGARLHADPRQGGRRSGLHRVGRRASMKEAAAKADDPNKVWELRDAGRARREGLRRQLRRPATRPTARAAGPIKALDGSPMVLDADKAQADPHRAERRQGNGAMPAWKQLSDTEIAAVITYTRNNWSTRPAQVVQPTEVAAARK